MSVPTSNNTNTQPTQLRRNRHHVSRAQRNPWTSPASILALVILAVAFLAA